MEEQDGKIFNEKETQDIKNLYKAFIKRPFLKIKNNLIYFSFVLLILSGVTYASYHNGYHNGSLWQCKDLGGERILSQIDNQWHCMSRAYAINEIINSGKGKFGELLNKELIEQLKIDEMRFRNPDGSLIDKIKSEEELNKLLNDRYN